MPGGTAPVMFAETFSSHTTYRRVLVPTRQASSEGLGRSLDVLFMNIVINKRNLPHIISANAFE